MPFKSPTPCRCGRKVLQHGKCSICLAKSRRQEDRVRGTAHERGYGRQHQERFREGVLAHDHWVCRMCGAPAKVADHYPRTRRELIEAGADPDDPRYGRALCISCHNRHTGRTTQADLKQRRRR